MKSIFFMLLLCLSSGIAGAPRDPAPARRTVLSMQETRFTLDGRPTFLLGISYYGALGASEEFAGRDLVTCSVAASTG
jgi:hypothetical protein